jgi:hypothetical protein
MRTRNGSGVLGTSSEAGGMVCTAPAASAAASAASQFLTLSAQCSHAPSDSATRRGPPLYQRRRPP